MELQGRQHALAQQGITLAAVSYDSASVLADFSARRGITFPLLSDPGSATIKRFGIFNTTVPESSQQTYGVPFPGTFMLDHGAVVTSRFFEEAYQERNTVASILARLGSSIDVPATRVSSPQAAITSFASDTEVAPGTHFSVVVDVQPGRGMHVYAPGVIGYRPVALIVDPQPWVAVAAAKYPTAEDYFFKPLDEHVPVYRQRFRIVQDIVIDASTRAQSALKDVAAITLAGTLHYQACDNRVCFSPQTVALSWRVALRQLDRERVR